MCIIVFKPKGIKLPDESILRRCYQNNSDGVGIAIQKDNAITIKKFLKWKTFNKYQKRNARKEDNVIYHFRIATHGQINLENTHPFIITRNQKEIDSDFITTEKTILAHNGIISNLTDVLKKNSDTKLLALLLADEDIKPILFTKGIKALITSIIDTDRLIIMDNKGNNFMLGEFNQDKGIYYSNLTWKWTTYIYNYGWGEDGIYNNYYYARPYSGDIIAKNKIIEKAEQTKLLAESDCIAVKGEKCIYCETDKNVCYYWDLDENLCGACFNNIYNR